MQYTTRYCIMPTMRRTTIPFVILTISIVIIGYWWYALVWHSLSFDDETLRVHFLAVGQGDGILIETPNNHQILIDAGRGIQILAALDALLPAHDRTIDVAVLTHPDADHVGGFIPVFRRYAVGTILRSFISADTAVYEQVVSAMEEEGAQVYAVSQPHSFTLDGVRFDILWPVGTEIADTDAASLVLLISYGDIELLLTGDASAEIEEFLIASFPEKLIDIDILKAGHHGSKTSTAQSFLAHTKPNAIIYSAGKNNSYGHPHADVLGRVKVYAALYPDQRFTEHYTADGTVSFCIRPTSYTLCGQ